MEEQKNIFEMISQDNTEKISDIISKDTEEKKHHGTQTVQKAFELLYPGKEFPFDVHISFSGRFKDYNANVRRCNRKLEFRFSKSWVGVSQEIFIGLVQELFLKIIKDKKIKNTMYTNLYNNFVRNLHFSAPKIRTDPILENSFHRINKKYFNEIIEKPNLSWGMDSRSTLGTYDYKSDTITVSSIFSDHHDILDYIIYHELLHKKYKFRTSGSRSYHHTSEFRKEERAFENLNIINRKLRNILKSLPKKTRKSSILSSFGFFQKK